MSASRRAPSRHRLRFPGHVFTEARSLQKSFCKPAPGRLRLWLWRGPAQRTNRCAEATAIWSLGGRLFRRSPAAKRAPWALARMKARVTRLAFTPLARTRGFAPRPRPHRRGAGVSQRPHFQEGSRAAPWTPPQTSTKQTTNPAPEHWHPLPKGWPWMSAR